MLLFIALGLVFAVIWSSAFVVGALAVPELGAFPTLVLRFALSALLLLPWCLREGQLFATERVRHGLLLGVLNNGAYLGLCFYALEFISPALVIVCASCSPFMALVIAGLLGVERPSWNKITGMMIGVLGVVVITGVQLSWKDLTGMGLALLGTAAFALAAVLFRRDAQGTPLITLNFWQSVSGAVVLLPFAFLVVPDFGSVSLSAIGAVLYLTIGVSIGGMMLWLALIRMGGLAKASAFHLLVPLFGVVLTHFVFDTGIELRAVFGTVIIMAGLFLCLKEPARS